MRLIVLAALFVLGGCAVHNQAVTLDSFGSSITDGTTPDPEQPDACFSGRRDLCPRISFRQASPGPFLPAP